MRECHWDSESVRSAGSPPRRNVAVCPAATRLSCPPALTCTVPAKVVNLEGSSAIVDVRGNRVAADVSLLRRVAPGDYVLVHAGFAIRRYEPEEAAEVLALLDEAFPEGL